eukprot:GHVN01033663.1.p1 GENE.GHVN01033663.1~~GHVN01033663.1.p1  ORF type:complete len:199 (-),score=19.09 GHVN01033663.1:477-986(-)
MKYNSHIWLGAPRVQSLNHVQHKCSKIIQSGKGPKAIPLQSLKHRRLVSGLCVFFRMWNNISPPTLTKLLPTSATTKKTPRIRQRGVPLNQPPSRANYHLLSFVPLFTRLWNHVPADTDNDLNSLASFKKHVNDLPLTPILNHSFFTRPKTRVNTHSSLIPTTGYMRPS